jgi:type II secretory pathway pseudopilin PulG
MRIRRVVRFWPVLVMVGVFLVAYALWPARFKYTVGPETTYVTGPLDANGVPDYPAALNDRLGKDVTPDNNGNVLIWQALGPHPEGGTMPDEYFRRLGIPAPPEQGEYLLSWDKYFQAHLKTPPDDVLGLFSNEHEWKEHWDKRVDRAKKWPWRMKDEPEIAGWLKANEKPLALMIEAGKRPSYFNPLVSKSSDPTAARLISSLLPSVQKCREAGSLLACRAMAKAGDGEYEAAWQDLLACQRLGRMLARGGTLIEDLVGIALVAIATNAEVTLIGHGKHTSKRLLAWAADLRALPPMPPMADKFALSERFMTLDSLLNIAHHGLDGISALSGPSSPPATKNELLSRMFSRSIDFDPAFRNANRVFDECEAALRLPDRATRGAAIAQINSEVDQAVRSGRQKGIVGRMTASKSSRGEHIGNILIGLLLPSMSKVMDANDRTEQTQANLQVALALAAYRADTGRYPGKLEELIPNYIAVIPGDLFSGKPLIYRPKEAGYLLYSVGINGIDEDGRWTDDEPKGDDLRVRMPVEEPRAKDERPGK